MTPAAAARPLRVVHVDTERGWRGGQRQALWLATGLAARGHECLVVARPGEPLFTRAAAAGLRVEGAAPRFEGDPRAAWQLRRILERERADIVHAHASHAAGLAALARIGTGVRLVIARRVDFPLKRNVATRLKYGRADAVVAVSRAVGEVVARGGVARDRLFVVPDATDVSRTIVPANATTLAALGVRAAAPLVVQVAQLVGHKDPLTFVRAIAHVRETLPDVQALLVGDGPLRPAAAEEIASLGLAGTVHLAGYRADADSLLAAAHVAVLSSREEGMGSVLLDASLLGLPIAATDAGGIPEVVEHERTGLLAPRGEPVQLGAAILRLLRDPDLAHRLGAAAHARVREFSIERIVERTAAVYEQVLARHRGPPDPP